MVEDKDRMTPEESLRPQEVVSRVYSSFRENSQVVKEFEQTMVRWASYADGMGSRDVEFLFDGFIGEIAPEEGLLVAQGELLARDWLKAFDKALVMAKIFTGERSKTAHGGATWEYFFYGSKENSWQDVGERHVGAVLPGRNLNRDPNSAALYTWHDRLILAGREVAAFVARSPVYNERYSHGTGLLSGVFIDKEASREKYSSPWSGSVPIVQQPAEYDSQVIDFLTGELRKKLSLPSGRF